MDKQQAAKIAAKKSNFEGPQYVVWVFDQGRDVFNGEQARRYAPLIHIEAVYIGGVDIPQEVAV
jgi:hypothetical protein